MLFHFSRDRDAKLNSKKKGGGIAGLVDERSRTCYCEGMSLLARH